MNLQAGETLLDVRDLHVEFRTAAGWTPVLEGVSLSVDRGETVGLVGESGSGKSVTGLTVMGLLPRRVSRVTGGEISFEGESLVGAPERRLRGLRGDRMAMVFQEPMTSLNPAFTVGDQIAEAVRVHRNVGRKAALSRAAEVLDLVGIAGARRRLGAYPHEFSGGMRQRVMIAMAISCEPDLLICDEPTTALDVTVQAQVLELLAELQRMMGMSILLVTHDLAIVAETCDRVITMYAGEVVERAAAADLFARPAHPYSAGLLHSVASGLDANGELPFIPGRPPDLHRRPTGCRFHPRCPHAADRCAEEHPRLLTVGPQESRCHFAGALELDGVDGPSERTVELSSAPERSESGVTG